MKKIELLVIHEENLHEAENKEDDDKCKFYETKNHRRVLREDIELLEQYGTITISRKEKEAGVCYREEDEDKRKIPDNAALFVVGETKHKSKYVAMYCHFNDDFKEKESTDGVIKKKKKFFNFPIYKLFFV